MINEPTITIECDHCCEIIEIELESADYNFDCSDKVIIKKLLKEEDSWIANENRQYCSKKCKEEQEAEE